MERPNFKTWLTFERLVEFGLGTSGDGVREKKVNSGNFYNNDIPSIKIASEV